MKKNVLVTVMLSLLVLMTNAQVDTFEKIENRTWLENNGFAGTNIVFYKTANGLLKAIRQLNGSGVPVISSCIYDVVMREDTIELINGLNLKTSERISEIDYRYVVRNEQIISNGEALTLILQEPILFSWSSNRKNTRTQIDMRLLSEISIERNEIYKEDDLIKTQIESKEALNTTK